MIYLDSLKPIPSGAEAALVYESDRPVKLVAIAVPAGDVETVSNFVIVDVSVGWNGPIFQHRLTVKNIHPSEPHMCRFNGLEAHELRIEPETGNTVGEMQRDGSWAPLTALSVR